jgi:hypothetical protein
MFFTNFVSYKLCYSIYLASENLYYYKTLGINVKEDPKIFVLLQ